MYVYVNKELELELELDIENSGSLVYIILIEIDWNVIFWDYVQSIILNKFCVLYPREKPVSKMGSGQRKRYL